MNYKLNHRPMGVFQMRHIANNTIFIDSSNNVPGKIKRHRFQLEANGHPNKKLQHDWNEFGAESFEFETIEPLEPRDNPKYDHSSDLKVLEDLWVEKLAPFDERGYNEGKKSREERLRTIAASQNRELLRPG